MVWQQAVALTKAIYEFSEDFPASERYGLAAQMRRAAVSIASNVAEGAARAAPREKLQFYFIARGSLSELDTQMEIVRQIGIGPVGGMAGLEASMSRLSALLQGLIEGRRRKLSPPPNPPIP